MEIADIPGMKPDATARNALIATAYLVIGLPLTIAVASSVLAFSPFIVGFAVWRNWRGAADRASSIPGIAAGGGAKSGLAAFGVTLIGVFIIYGAVGVDGDTESSSASEDDSGQPDDVEAQAATETDETDGEQATATDGGETVTEEPEPEPTPEETPEPTPEPEPETEESSSDDDSERENLDEFKATIESNGIDVVDVERDGDTIYLTYTSVQTTESGVAEEMGTIAGAYSVIVDDGDSSERLEVSVEDALGDEAGTYHADSEWAQAYADGEITAEEFSYRVLNTLEATG